MKKLPSDYTAEALDKGLGMKFHPVDGESMDGWEPRYDEIFVMLKTVFFDDESHTYSRYGGLDNWHFCKRIGDGDPRMAGDPYLKHWKFDPYTGESLTSAAAVDVT